MKDSSEAETPSSVKDRGEVRASVWKDKSRDDELASDT